MSRLGVLVTLASVTASAFAWGWYSDSVSDRERRAIASQGAADHTLATSATSQRSRVFSAKDPLLATPHLMESTTARSAALDRPTITARNTVIAARNDEPVAPKRMTPPVSSKSLTSLRPGDADARAQLVRDIQYELKRVGCYGGEVHGGWNSGTKHAMKLFTDRVNATLPLEEPDYVLLTLVQNENPGTCGSGCPDGQLASENGRCLPRAIMAQQRNARAKGVTVATPDQERGVAGVSHPSASAPLPGRMGVGAAADESVVPRQTLATPGTTSGDAQAASDNPGPPQVDARHNPRRSAATTKRARPPIQRGSTRQVFSKLMQFAP